MITKELIARINELARKAGSVGLKKNPLNGTKCASNICKLSVRECGPN
jgi:hypothetical protein